MIIMVPDIALESIEEIQEWFRESMGFTPSKNNIANFAVASLGSIPMNDMAEKKFKVFNGDVTIKLDDENSLKFELLFSHGNIYSVQRRTLMTVLLAYRAATLPSLKLKKKFEIIDDNNLSWDRQQIKAYTPRFLKVAGDVS